MTTKKNPSKKLATKKTVTTTKAGSTKVVVKAVKTNLAATLSSKSLMPYHFIDIDTANQMIANATELDNRPAMDYGKDIIMTLLNQEGVVGLRIYNATNDTGEKTYVIKGYDSNNYDVLLNIEGSIGAVDMGQPCNMEPSAYQSINQH